MTRPCTGILAVVTGCLAFAWQAAGGDGRIEIARHMVPYRITNSASYVVTEDLVCTNDNVAVIKIDADFVTLDLNGHTLTQEGNLYGIHAPDRSDFITVRNGTVLCTAQEDYCVYLQGKCNRIESVDVRRFWSIGIHTGIGSLVRDCRARDTTVSAALEWGIYAESGSAIFDSSVAELWDGTYQTIGIRGGNGSLVVNCSAAKNTALEGTCTGIRVGRGSVVADSVAEGNVSSGGAAGITAGSGSVVAGCVARGNLDTSGSDGSGIVSGDGSVVADCAVSRSENGIRTGGGCVVVGSTVNDASAAGVSVGSGCAVRNCSLREAAIWADNATLIAGCNLREEDDPHFTLIDVNSYCYVLENYVWGYATGVKCGGDMNRVDRNWISNIPEVDARGGRNLIVRNRSNNWQVENAGNDYVGTDVTGASGMSTIRPWGNVDY